MSSLEMPFKVFHHLENMRYTLESVETHSFPISFQNVSMVSFKIIHSARRQDHTPRVYISEKPRDLSLSWGGPIGSFHLQRKPYQIRIIKNGLKQDQSVLYTYITTKEVVYLNVQNLENFTNGYKVSELSFVEDVEDNSVAC